MGYPSWLPSNPLQDPQAGEHRTVPYPTAYPIERAPTSQDPQGGAGDHRYPFPSRAPLANAQGFPTGRSSQPVGYDGLDHGPIPQRIPRLWRDGLNAWDGLRQWAGTQQFYRAQLRHLRPSYPTRGYRSISGVMAPTSMGSTRIRVPAVFIRSLYEPADRPPVGPSWGT